MAKSPAVKSEPIVPTYEFRFFRSKTNSNEFTSEYLRDGEVVFSIDAPNSYIYNAAVMERKLRLAVHE